MRELPILRFVASVTLALAIDAGRTAAQVNPPPPPGTPTATVAAGERYKAGWFKRFFLGDNYRDLWSTPITVPVLDLRTTAGGLTPTEIGGSKQTKSLQFKNASGSRFVFRLVDKDGLSTPEGYDKTIVEWTLRDQVSTHHPAGATTADVLLRAAGVLHPSPILAVMPDDSLLGKFRKEFAGRLGMFEAYPDVPDGTTGFAGAMAIIDSDSLVKLIDHNPRQQVDARAYLRARLMDMLMNDWDRNPGQWKWARMEPGAPWQPIARDRDKALIDYGGVAAIIGPVVPQLVRFQGEYPRMSGLTSKSAELDRRLLSGLEVSAYDSIAVDLQGRLTNAVIDSAVHAMPREYHERMPEAAANLKTRRDRLPEQARLFYKNLAEVVNIHATDAADSATVTLVDKRYVDIAIRSGGAEPYYRRRFDKEDTRQIRLYLHEGDDRAEVGGDAKPAMKVRVIGGNGKNDLIKASDAANHTSKLKFYDNGDKDNVAYGEEPTFDRRPWFRPQMGPPQRPARDWGSGLSPAARLDSEGDELGLMAGLGVTRKSYGFGRHPYSNRIQLFGEYSFGVNKFRVLGDFDKWWEKSPFHLTARAHWSELEIINFYGFGNDTQEVPPESYYDASHRQWMVYPALNYALGPNSDIAVGAVFKSSVTDTVPGHFISDTQPYGVGDFDQLGFRVGLYKDSRIRQKDHYRGLLIDLTATTYPEMMDVTSQFEVYALNTAGYITIPMIKRPFFSLKAGASHVRGIVPFHESAFVGGEPSERKLPYQRYAGDTAYYGSAELRIPLFGFPLLVPIDVGTYVYTNTGRVYLDNQSPGGWHTSSGAGVWIGILNPMSGVSVDLGNYVGRNIVQAKIGFKF